MTKKTLIAVAPLRTAHGSDFIEVDECDSAAFCNTELKKVAGVWKVRKVGWHRWKWVTVYLTGTLCAHRNNNNDDFQRDNLRPCLPAWQK